MTVLPPPVEKKTTKQNIYEEKRNLLAFMENWQTNKYKKYLYNVKKLDLALYLWSIFCTLQFSKNPFLETIMAIECNS